jgi:hypothetical protein
MQNAFLILIDIHQLKMLFVSLVSTLLFFIFILEGFEILANFSVSFMSYAEPIAADGELGFMRLQMKWEKLQGPSFVFFLLTNLVVVSQN